MWNQSLSQAHHCLKNFGAVSVTITAETVQPQNWYLFDVSVINPCSYIGIWDMTMMNDCL